MVVVFVILIWQWKEERKMGYKRMEDDGSDKERPSSFVTAREQYVSSMLCCDV